MAPNIHFLQLPTEIMDLIFEHLSNRTLKSISLVNKRLWVVSTPRLFSEVKIRFSIDGLKVFEEISISRLASFVKTLNYEARELVDPSVKSFDYFKTCIYTPEEYIRDQRDFDWDLQGGDISYGAIHEYFSHLAYDQLSILKKRYDIRILCECIKRLRLLKVLKLSFDETHHNRFYWFASRAFQDWNNSFPLHLQTTVNLLLAARLEEVSIDSVEISGFQAGLSQSAVQLSTLAAEGFFPIKRIRLENSFSLTSFFARLDLPHLQQLDLDNCVVAGSDLGTFVKNHHASLRRVSLKRIYLHRGVISLNPSLRPLKKLFESCYRRQSYMIESVTLDLLEEVLLDNVSL